MTGAPGKALACLLLAFATACGTTAVAEDDPQVWLDRMANATQTLDYEGTVIRISEDRAEALKVVHSVSDGVIRERVVAQEGNGLEIIRNGNEVHCILPESRSVLVEEWNDQSTLFSTLPTGRIRTGNQYDLVIMREERVAGRPALMLAIKPHDNFRYEHRVWLDVETGFPLQTQLIGDDDSWLELVKFADISLDSDVLSSALTPSYSTEDYRWLSSPRRESTPVDVSGLHSEDLPPGFRVTSAQEETLLGSDEPVTHIMYSDGLATVSVFISTHSGDAVTERSSTGASNTYSVVVADHRVTAVGDVPAATVKRIADSIVIE